MQLHPPPETTPPRHRQVTWIAYTDRKRRDKREREYTNLDGSPTTAIIAIPS